MVEIPKPNTPLNGWIQTNSNGCTTISFNHWNFQCKKQTPKSTLRPDQKPPDVFCDQETLLPNLLSWKHPCNITKSPQRCALGGSTCRKYHGTILRTFDRLNEKNLELNSQIPQLDTHTWSGVKNSGRLRTKMIFLVEKQNKGSKWFRFAGLVEKSRSFKIRFALFCWRAFLHFSSPSSFPKKAAFKGFWNSGTRKNLRQENMLPRTHSHMYMTFVFVWKAAKMVPIVFVGSWANPGYVLQLLHMLFIAAPSLVTSARSLTQILPNPPVTVLINLQLLNALPGFCEMSFFQKCSHYFRVKWASPIYYTCPFGNDRVWHRWVSSPEMLLTKSCTVTSCPNIQLINPHFISFSKTSLWPVQVETWVFKVSHMRLHRMTHKLFSVQTCLIGGGDNLHKPRTL